MKKRGMSHIEMILSFIIFIVAIGFALYFFSPSNESKIVATSFTYGFNEIIKNTSVDVDIFFIKLDSEAIGTTPPPSGCTFCTWVNGECSGVGNSCPVGTRQQTRVCEPSGCGGGESRCEPDVTCAPPPTGTIGKSDPAVGIDSPDSVDIIAFDLDAEEGDGTYTKTFTSPPRELASSKIASNGEVYVKDPNFWAGVDFISITVNEDLASDIVSPIELRIDYYDIISFKRQAMISEKRVRALKAAYDSDYFVLKERFNFPSRANFGFSLKMSTGEIITERAIPSNFEVFSDTKRVEILREIGESEFGELKVWIW